MTQSEKFDPEGKFIWPYLPELTTVPARHIHARWGMSASEQKDCGVLVGRDYPVPIVEHGAARTAALELYSKAQG